MAALMVLAAVSCKKDNTPGNDEPGNDEPGNQLPSTVWTATWNYTLSSMSIPFKATLVFEEEMVRLVISSLELRVDEMPCIFSGRSPYLFEETSGGGGQVSFTLSFQSSVSPNFLSETPFSGMFNPDSEVLTLKVSNNDGKKLLGQETFNFIKESKLTTKINPFPATKWTASWTGSLMDTPVPFSAILAFDGITVNMVISSELKVNNTPLVIYGNAPYQFQYLSETDRRGNIYFKVSPRCSTFTIPEITFSGEYTEGSQVMTLDVSAENNSTLGQKALDFVRN